MREAQCKGVFDTLRFFFCCVCVCWIFFLKRNIGKISQNQCRPLSVGFRGLGWTWRERELVRGQPLYCGVNVCHVYTCFLLPALDLRLFSCLLRAALSVLRGSFSSSVSMSNTFPLRIFFSVFEIHLEQIRFRYQLLPHTSWPVQVACESVFPVSVGTPLRRVSRARCLPSPLHRRRHCLARLSSRSVTIEKR